MFVFRRSFLPIDGPTLAPRCPFRVSLVGFRFRQAQGKSVKARHHEMLGCPPTLGHMALIGLHRAGHLKQLISNKTGIAQARQCLAYCGSMLENAHSLALVGLVLPQQLRVAPLSMCTFSCA